LFLNYGQDGNKCWDEDFIKLTQPDYVCPGDVDPFDDLLLSNDSGADPSYHGRSEGTTSKRTSPRLAARKSDPPPGGAVLDVGDGKRLGRERRTGAGSKGKVVKGAVRAEGEIRSKGSEKSNDESDDESEELEDVDIDKAKCEITDVNGVDDIVTCSVTHEWLEKRRQELADFIAKQHQKADGYFVSKIKPDIVRRAIVTKGYYLFKDDNEHVEKCMEKLMVYDCGHQLGVPAPEDFDFAEVFSNILDNFLSKEKLLLQFEWRNENVERGWDFEYDETDRWSNGKSDLEFFAKYVDMIDPLVREVHKVLFPATNKRVEFDVGDPTLHLACAKAITDEEPICLSSSNGITYLYHFPIPSRKPAE
jgi:hypothetical protein